NGEGAGGAGALGNGYGVRVRVQREVGITQANGKDERPDASTPVEGSVGFLVLVGVPEGAIVGRVKLDAAVIAPTVQAVVLGTGAFHDAVFRLEHARSIAGKAAGEANRGVDAAAGRAVADGNIGIPIVRDASHPTICAIGSIGSLLIEGNVAGWVIKLIPSESYLTSAGTDCMVGHRPV